MTLDMRSIFFLQDKERPYLGYSTSEAPKLTPKKCLATNGSKFLATSRLIEPVSDEHLTTTRPFITDGYGWN
jgi:hypothetical protein